MHILAYGLCGLLQSAKSGRRAKKESEVPPPPPPAPVDADDGDAAEEVMPTLAGNDTRPARHADVCIYLSL